MDDFTRRTITRPRQLWSLTYGHSPVIGTAIHDGHHVRDELLPLMNLSDQQRLYEEDPFTAQMISGLTNKIAFHRSRFEIDLNRAREQAIYLTPEQSWGLEVWKDRPDDEALRRSLTSHQQYYSMLENYLAGIEIRFGQFVVLDIHTYNHRRSGPDAAPTTASDAPDINIGTSSMDRDRWAYIVDGVIDHFAQAKIGGRHLDVRENIAFQGRGEQTKFIHEKFRQNGCAIAVEFKKIFMDEWTGEPDTDMLSDISETLASLEVVLERMLESRP
ncbi:N-formylglutamate amidohydrolase [Agrobacterium larrymoorei]|uniref:N-formylglutamate amidohydrolase n=1 Tax=Agrobacterium larrymoorei TaxID=160699 RepID=UPI0015728F09|nr:N-formylglutamate amidohydrolase [Agrobacterium larrymoorei]NTJ44834.1 N-formylglutamate amidohydrolase [Agrobacterium larrymoorei]